MNKAKKVLVELLIAAVFPAILTCPAWALFYDFEDDNQANDWQVLDGAGTIEDGRYILNNTDSSSGIAVIKRLCCKAPRITWALYGGWRQTISST